MTRVIDTRPVPLSNRLVKMGALKLGSSSLSRRAIATLDERFDDFVPLAQATRGERDALSATGWAETMPSYFYATPAISAPGTPGLLRGIPQVGHVFSRGCCFGADPRPLFG